MWGRGWTALTHFIDVGCVASFQVHSLWSRFPQKTEGQRALALLLTLLTHNQANGALRWSFSACKVGDFHIYHHEFAFKPTAVLEQKQHQPMSNNRGWTGSTGCATRVSVNYSSVPACATICQCLHLCRHPLWAGAICFSDAWPVTTWGK